MTCDGFSGYALASGWRPEARAGVEGKKKSVARGAYVGSATVGGHDDLVGKGADLDLGEGVASNLVDSDLTGGLLDSEDQRAPPGRGEGKKSGEHEEDNVLSHPSGSSVVELRVFCRVQVGGVAGVAEV